MLNDGYIMCPEDSVYFMKMAILVFLKDMASKSCFIILRNISNISMKLQLRVLSEIFIMGLYFQFHT